MPIDRPLKSKRWFVNYIRNEPTTKIVFGLSTSFEIMYWGEYVYFVCVFVFKRVSVTEK